MEAFTGGKVSWRARQAYVDQRGPQAASMFRPVRSGVYMMTGWESQIQFARAMGRGHARGDRKRVSRYDMDKA